MENAENVVGRRSEGESFISPKRIGCLVAFLYFPQAVIGLLREWRRSNNIAEKIAPEIHELIQENRQKV